MKMRTALVATIGLLTVVITPTSHAALITFSPAVDGGVEMTATGDAGITYPLDNSFSISLDSGGVLGSAFGSPYSANASDGSFTVGPDNAMVTGVSLHVGPSSDTIYFAIDSYLNMGETSFNDISATWSVDVLAFDTLTPGTYSAMFMDATVVVVPAPGAFALFGLAGLTGRRRRR